MPSVKMLNEWQREMVETHFYQVWAGTPADLYEFIVQESAAFVAANPGCEPFRVLVEKEMLRLARLER